MQESEELNERNTGGVTYGAPRQSEAELEDPCPRCGGDHDRIDSREPCPSQAYMPAEERILGVGPAGWAGARKIEASEGAIPGFGISCPRCGAELKSSLLGILASEAAQHEAWHAQEINRAFGELAGAIAAELQRPGEFLEDPITIASGAGGELLPAIHQGAATAIAALLEEAGISAAEFDAELARRTSPAWAYGFGSVEGFLEAI